jgi:FKBP-type peptidyl-prolyl cis-trans isomerase FklB
VNGQRITERALEARYADNKAAGEKFLAENKTKEGVVTTESGLQYKIITEGKGAIPAKTDRVSVNYKGTLIDGTEFDSSYKNNKPAVFGASQVIPGWTEALTMMPVGSKWELYIPQDLAYGSRETGSQIKPFSTLIFEVELVGIEK